MKVDNLLAAIPAALPEELETLLAGGGECRLKRIVSRGHASAPDDWYDQEDNEWVMVVSGRGRLAFEDGSTVEMGPGDYLLIPARCRHRVDWTAPDTETVWLALYFN